jgi:predicted DNA-binding transcriptional regulator YafY
MRHDKAHALIDLARRLAASAEGLTLDEMAAAAGVGRRTAERMRDALERLFPEMEMLREGVVKRWRITGGLGGFFHAPTLDELAELGAAQQALAAQGFSARAASLATLEQKIRGAMKAPALRRLAPDIEALARTEIHGARVGPRPHDDPAMLGVIRTAILSMDAISFVYQGGSTPGRRRTLRPLGLILDRSTYLVACDLEKDEPRNFRLDRMADVAAAGLFAPPPKAFDLEAYVRRSFGIYQDAIETVRLKVLPHGQDEARAWLFHPGQTVRETAEGGMEVTFASGGMRELAWHLVSWGDKLRVLEPESLKAEMREALALAARQLG